jgi:hypothetical protein
MASDGDGGTNVTLDPQTRINMGSVMATVQFGPADIVLPAVRADEVLGKSATYEGDIAVQYTGGNLPASVFVSVSLPSQQYDVFNAYGSNAHLTSSNPEGTVGVESQLGFGLLLPGPCCMEPVLVAVEWAEAHMGKPHSPPWNPPPCRSNTMPNIATTSASRGIGSRTGRSMTLR